MDTAGASPTRQPSREPVAGRAFSTIMTPALSRTYVCSDSLVSLPTLHAPVTAPKTAVPAHRRETVRPGTLFRNHPPKMATRAVEDYRRVREAADRQLVLDYAKADAAAALAQTIQSSQGSFADLTANGNLSRAHVSRCVHWLIGSLACEMPPELPQTCSCLQQPPSAGLVALQRPERARRGRSPTLATADRILAFMSDYDGTQGPEDSGINH